MADADFREQLRPFLLKVKGATQQSTDNFLRRCVYRQGQYDSADDFGRVAEVGCCACRPRGSGAD
jgi:hypothetical protein